MSLIFLATDFAQGTAFVQEKATEIIPLPAEYIIPAIILIAITIFVFFFLKKIIVNCILGAIIWAGATFLLNLIPFSIPYLVVSVVFGPAGVGVIIFLKVFGVI